MIRTGGSEEDGYTLTIFSDPDNWYRSRIQLYPPTSQYAGQIRLTAQTNADDSKQFIISSDGACKFLNQALERIVETGTNYIKYASGKQIVYQDVSNISNTGTTITFPKAFSSNPVVVATHIGNVNTVNVIIKSLSTTNVTFVASYQDPVSIHYIAIGYSA